MSHTNAAWLSPYSSSTLSGKGNSSIEEHCGTYTFACIHYANWFHRLAGRLYTALSRHFANSLLASALENMAIPGSPFTRQFLENSIVLEQPAKRRPNELLERTAPSGRLYSGHASRLFSCNAALVCDSHTANGTIFSTYLLQLFCFLSSTTVILLRPCCLSKFSLLNFSLRRSYVLSRRVKKQRRWCGEGSIDFSD